MAEGDANFALAAEIFIDGDVRLRKFKSNVSGLTVCIAEIDGPVVAGYLCVGTEAHDDDGLPHTLEHLIFTGSEKYPYRGVLERLANRCLSSGTNAWTDTDHTCYTMKTAGDEGFLKLLPIFVEHILYPTLTESAYLTEVHHINGEGEDAGVVYCEMQARENSGESRCYLELLRAVYPGHCGYKSETGGLVKNIRENTSNERVRAYHKEFYRPENLCIIIIGSIDPEKVFDSLAVVENRILSDGEHQPFTRPWSTPIPPLEESVELSIDYPTDDDEGGIVIIAWRGPLFKDFKDIISVQLLLDYLTNTSVAPLMREFVEIEDPLCNGVDYSTIENSVSCNYLYFSNVSKDKLVQVKDKLFEVLDKIANGTESLDMERLRTVVRKRKLYILSYMESSPYDQISTSLIGDFLYGTTKDDLEQRVCEIPIIEKLDKEPADYWIELLKRYILDQKYVLVIGNPSPALSEELAEAEKERVKKQIEDLGPECLKEKAQILKEALEINLVPPPKDMLSSITVPSLKSIKFHPVKRICNVIPMNEGNIDFPIDKMPCRFQVDDFRTNFVRVTVLLDTSHLSQELKLFLPLFIELLDESAIKRNGEIVPHKKVIKQLAEDTICVAALIGQQYSRFFCGMFAQVVSLYLMVEEEKYITSVQWIQDILYHIVFEAKRVKTSIKKMKGDLASLKRRAGVITRMMMKNLCYTPESNHWCSSMLRQQTFLTNLQQQLDSNPDEVIEMLNKVREAITKPDKMTVHLSFNLDNLKKKIEPGTVWIKDFLPCTETPGIMNSCIKQCYDLVKPICQDEVNAIITGLGSIETTNLLQCAPCIKSYIHPDYPPLLLLLQYLTLQEGPMSKKIRGQGLSYDFNAYIIPSHGLIYFTLSRSTHPLKAYEEVLNLVESLSNGKWEWEDSLLEAAVSSLVFDLIASIKTVDHISEESLAAYYKNVDFKFFESLLENIAHITKADMEKVAGLYLQPLFNPKSSRLTVCCNPSKIDELVEGFKKLSRNLTVMNSLEDSFMAQL